MKTILAATLCFASVIISFGQSSIVLPTDDGFVYSFGETINFQAISISGTSFNGIIYDAIEGDIHFAQFDTSGASIQLELSPFSLPVASPVYVYGFGSTTAGLSGSDFNAGSLLGTWNFGGLTYGQETFFDVTSFVRSVSTPYFGFELQAPGLASFSSSAENYGTPPELIVIPEPSALLLAGIGLVSVLALTKRQRCQ